MRTHRIAVLVGLTLALMVGLVPTAQAAPAPTITSANNATFHEGMFGTFTVTTTGSPTPVLSEVGALPFGVTFVDNGDGTATISGTPFGAGPYPIDITAANGDVPDAVQPFTLTVVGLYDNHFDVLVSGTGGGGTITDNSGSLTTGANPSSPCVVAVVGHTHCWNYSSYEDEVYTVTATPAPGSVFVGWDPFFPGPCAGSFNPVCSYSPFYNSNDRAMFDDPVAPAITSGNNTAFDVGAAGTFTVTTTGAPVPGLSSVGALPAGVTFTDNGDGTATLAGMPGAGTAGTYPLTFTAANGVLPDATQNFTLTVNESPAITSANSTTFVAGAAGTFTVTTTGLPTPGLSSVGALPAGVTFTDNGDGTATLAGTPGAGTGGTYPLDFTAANGVLPDATQNFTLTVNQAPVITSANATAFPVGVPGTFTVTTTGLPTPGLSSVGALPAGVTFTDNGDGTATLAGTPAAGTGGTYPLDFTAANGILPDATQSFTLMVDSTRIGLDIGPKGEQGSSSHTVTLGPGGRAALDLRVANRGTLVDSFILQSRHIDVVMVPSSGPIPPPSWNRFYLKFIDGGIDVSRKVQAGTYVTPLMGPGDSYLVRVQVRLDKNVFRGVQRTWQITATSQGDPSVTKSVELTVRSKG